MASVYDRPKMPYPTLYKSLFLSLSLSKYKGRWRTCQVSCRGQAHGVETELLEKKDSKSVKQIVEKLRLLLALIFIWRFFIFASFGVWLMYPHAQPLSLTLMYYYYCHFRRENLMPLPFWFSFMCSPILKMCYTFLKFFSSSRMRSDSSGIF